MFVSQRGFSHYVPARSLAGWLCPVTLPCLVWSCWPKPRTEDSPKPTPADAGELPLIPPTPIDGASLDSPYDLYSDE